MKYEVILKLHEDDVTGTWGLCHPNTIGRFNAFWGADGVFHDVFEHYFEGIHPYFSGKAELTLWGEMAASGHAIAYRNIGIDSFQYRKGFNRRDFTADTMGYLQEAVYECKQEKTLEPYMEYSIDKSLCKVPYQKDPDCSELHHWVNEYLYYVDKERDSENSLTSKFIRKVSKSCIKRCYYWGYKRAMKIISSDINNSYNVLQEFLETWNTICKSEPREIYIMDEDAYEVNKFKFIVSTTPKLMIKTLVLDAIGNEYPLELLNILN